MECQQNVKSNNATNSYKAFSAAVRKTTRRKDSVILPASITEKLEKQSYLQEHQKIEETYK